MSLEILPNGVFDGLQEVFAEFLNRAGCAEKSEGVDRAEVVDKRYIELVFPMP